jgi:DNA polymerase I-like protein with 3'-5' exonuclease and polymerase domains
MIGTERIEVELDIESHKIVSGAPLRPVPVGVALGIPGQPRLYLAWGHPEGNNCTKEQAREVLLKYWDEIFITHNGLIFDIPVLTHYFDLPERDPLLTHDTLFAAYLQNPHARSLSLKDLANDWLGIAPDEQQEMYDWIAANVPGAKRSEAGAYIADTPVSLSGPYAVGDILRTRELFEFVRPAIASMQEPYDRERRLAPILSRLQNGGIRVDEARLKTDCHKANIKRALLDQLIREHLKVGPDFEVKDAALAARLKELGYEGFILTPTGKPSMGKASLEAVLESDPKLKKLLESRSLYDTLIGTFMEPWLRYCQSNGGRIHPSYNQVRNPDGFGTRTGRLSSTNPNGQNVPKNKGLDYWDEPFPDMRGYLLPEVGQVWFCGDFKSQEPRLTAHFEGGALMEAYLEDPRLDCYQWIKDLVGGDVSRHEAKQIFLGLVYAMGVARLADKLDCSESRAQQLRTVIKAMLPDVVELDSECKNRFKKGLPIRTLGGRIYYCEPPSGGRTWDYKALNTLIQGSAADQNKEAMLYLDPKIVDIHGRLISTVHDEISCSVFEKDVVYVEQIYQEAANYLKCDVPMIFDTGYGDSWATGKPD